MPKQKITAGEILDVSLELIQEQGYEKINARSIAQRMNCSVQPIYSCFGNMEGLIQQLFSHAKKYLDRYVDAHADRSNYFESIGKCHIGFANDEKNLFRFLFQSPYIKASSIEDIYRMYSRVDVAQDISSTLGLSEEDAEKLYTHMMVYTHGIACMIAADAVHFSCEDIHARIDFAYWSFLQNIKEENNETHCS